jgi:hypothetical protein
VDQSGGPGRVPLIEKPSWLFRAIHDAARLIESPIVRDAARATRAPTEAEVAAIDALIQQAMGAALRDEESTARDLVHQAIDDAVRVFGIDVSAVAVGSDGRPQISYGGLDPGGAYGGFQKDGSIRVYVDALLKGQSSARFLGGILVHEMTHANQFRAHGWAQPDTQNRHAAEYMAHSASLRDENLGLDAAQRRYFDDLTARHRGKLTPASLEEVERSGRYWGL